VVGAEARLAVLSMLGMLYLAIVAAAAAIVAWCLLMLLAIALLEDQGISWRWSAVVIIVLHAVAVLACGQIVARLSRNLTLPVVRQILGSSRTRGKVE
jgi:hypothetical protein